MGSPAETPTCLARSQRSARLVREPLGKSKARLNSAFLSRGISSSTSGTVLRLKVAPPVVQHPATLTRSIAENTSAVGSSVLAAWASTSPPESNLCVLRSPFSCFSRVDFENPGTASFRATVGTGAATKVICYKASLNRRIHAKKCGRIGVINWRRQWGILFAIQRDEDPE